MKAIILLLIALCILLLIILWFFGPRYILKEVPSEIPVLPENLEKYIEENESTISGLKTGVQKEILWANKTKSRTKYAIIYLHGFSSSRKELSPVLENTASSLAANLFFTRFRGHGTQSGEPLGEVDRIDWMEDTLEAIAIGQRLGEKLILVGTSHGGLLASWAATLKSNIPIEALVLVSPNFGPKDKRTKLIALPWAKQILPLTFGKHRKWEAQNSGHEYYWNTRYPSHALFPMMAQVNYITPRAPKEIKCPTLIFYSAQDTTVKHTNIEQAIEAIPSKNKRVIPIENSIDRNHHILAGDILSPNTTTTMQDQIIAFIHELK